jgi:cytoskeletal protein RodZ
MADEKQDDLGLFSTVSEEEELLVDDGEDMAAENDVPDEVYDVHFSEEFQTAGACLRQKRLSLGMSLEMVEEETKMKASHIRALEEGDVDELPQPVHAVYIVASVKKLGVLYGLDEETLAGITAGLKEQILCRAPDDLSKSCYGHEVSEASIRQQKRLLFALFAIAGVILLAVTLGIVLLVRFFLFPPEEKVLNTPFDPETLLEIQPKVKLQTTPLPSVDD